MMALYVAKTSNTAVKVNGIVTAVAGVSSGGTVVEREMEASEISYDIYGSGGGGGASRQFRMILTVPELISETKNVIAVIVDYVVTEDANTKHKGCLIYSPNGRYNYQMTTPGGSLMNMSIYISLSGDKIIVPLRLGTSVTYPTTINKAIVIYEDLGG